MIKSPAKTLKKEGKNRFTEIIKHKNPAQHINQAGETNPTTVTKRRTIKHIKEVISQHHLTSKSHLYITTFFKNNPQVIHSLSFAFS